MISPGRVLITGATGFAGRPLSRLALAQGAEVFGWARTTAFVPGVTGRSGDIADLDALTAWLRVCRPDWIFHLAALVHGTAVHTPADLIRVNVDGTRALLAAARAVVPGARILLASSSGVYGQPADPTRPLAESDALQPGSVYAETKVAQEQLAVDFFRDHGLATIRARTFNQTGPGEPAGLVCGSLARQVARLEAGLAPPVLRAITLRPSRDFCDVRDIAAGYWAALAHGAPGEVYNVCSGTSHAIAQVVDLLRAASTRPDFTVVESQPVPAPGAILHQVGDPARLHACSGWTPRIPLTVSLADLLADWRQRIGLES